MIYFNAREKIILRELSTDSRTSLSNMSKKAGCSYVTVGKVIDKLKEKLDIKFILELDLTKLGFLQKHVLMVKFTKKPDLKFLERTLKEEKDVIGAYITKGQFDMVIFAAESDPIKYVHWETLFIQKLSDYGAKVKSSDLPYFSFGFLPVDNTLIDNAKIKIKKDEIMLLKLLNDNSRISYSELARLLKTNESTIRYKLFNLLKRGIIKRFTIAAQNPPQEYIIGFFENWIFSKAFEQRAALDRKHMIGIDEQLPILTTFQMSAPLTGSYENFIIGLFDNETTALENTAKKHAEIYKTEGFEEKHARIIKSLKGYFPFRNLDLKEHYNVVKWE